jgi:hypothetical protein
VGCLFDADEIRAGRFDLVEARGRVLLRALGR